MEGIHSRVHAAKESLREKKTAKGWILPKQDSSWAPEGIWTNKDLDVTPPAQRTWTSLTILGYWISDILSVQSWETGSTILAVGLTWKEAVFSIIFGSTIMAIPMTLNGYAGALTHAPFPILARAAFGYHGAKFPIVVRMITALFWSSITNFFATPAMTQCIRAIWPSFATLPNTIPESVGITTQQMISYTIFWLIQLPLLLIPPYKLRWFFATKVVMMTATVVGTTIWICKEAGGSGDIWNQQATVSGPTKAWLTMWAVNSCTGSWATVGVNIPDFTRYMRTPRATLSQGAWFPLICSWIAIMGIVVTSASQIYYGTYLWDPMAIIATWDGPGGRAAAFFAGASWCIAQLGVNLSASIISSANDMTSLLPKYINIKRGVIITAVLGGWVMVPWKIIHSAASLLNFMSSLGVFLGPIIGIQICDFYIIKKRSIDIPALYQPYGRYHYAYGINWRAILALLLSITPQLPGLVHAVNPDLEIGGAIYLADMNFYFGVLCSFFMYWAANLVKPAKETLIPCMIHESTRGEMSIEQIEMEKNIAIEGDKNEIESHVSRL